MKLLFLGTPASGKSTIIKCLSELYNIETHNLDKVINKRYNSSSPKPSIPLVRSFLDSAVLEFINESQIYPDCIIELPHHNYIALLIEHRKWFDGFDHIFAITASTQTLLSRNAIRTDSIPEEYILDCSSMYEISRIFFQKLFGKKYVEINSECHDIQQTIQIIQRVIEG